MDAEGTLGLLQRMRFSSGGAKQGTYRRSTGEQVA